MLTKNIILLLTFFFSFCVFSAEGLALKPKPPSAELTAIHQRHLGDPPNNDILYEYAQAAILEGNFEAAIGALEGMLVIASNQPRVLLELGVLYQRLDAPGVARTYLQKATELSGEGSEIAGLAREYLDETEREDSRHDITGIIRFGLRYQSNPTLSPEAAEILSGGFYVPLPETRKRESDINGLLLSHINHNYRFSPRNSIASNFFGYGTFYDQNEQLNYGLLALDSGVKYESPRNANGHYSVRPHILLRGSSLDGSLFEKSSGAGLDFQFSPGVNTWMIPRLRARYQFRDIDYKDFNDRGTAPLHNGNDHRVDLRYYVELMRGHLLELGFFARHKGAKREYLTVNQYDVNLRYSLKYDNALFHGRPRMTFTPYVLGKLYEYGGASPDIDPDTTRRDREWQVGLRYHLPVTATWSLLLDVEHTEVSSNINNYETKNNLFMVGYQKEF